MCISPLAVVEVICAAECVGERTDRAGCVFLEGSGCCFVLGTRLADSPAVLGAEPFLEV